MVIFFNKYSPFKKIINLLASELIRENAKKYDSMAIISGDYISTKIMLDGRFELVYLDALAKQIFPFIKNNICIDAGANIGNHSVFFSRFFKKVYAFEPNKKPLEILKVNAKWNKNIEVVPYAVSDTQSIGYISQNQSNIGASKLVAKNIESNSLLLQIKLNLMDALIPKNQHANIGFIKLDVEGHEYEAMLGAEEIIVNSSPIIAFELLRKDYDVKFHKIRHFLNTHGYNKFMVYRFGKFRFSKKISKKNYKMILALPKKCYFNQKV